MFGAAGSKMMKMVGKGNKIREGLFPAMTGRTAMVNMSSFVRMIIPIAKKFIPAKAVAKIGFCPVADAGKGDPSTCPFLRSLGVLPADLPSFLRGTFDSSFKPRLEHVV